MRGDLHHHLAAKQADEHLGFAPLVRLAGIERFGANLGGAVLFRKAVASGPDAGSAGRWGCRKNVVLRVPDSSVFRGASQGEAAMGCRVHSNCARALIPA